MKRLFFLFTLITSLAFAQENGTVDFINKTAIKADFLVDVNNFGTSFYVLNNTLIKNNEGKLVTYSNVQLGNISSVDSFNPLKINLFYNAFNTVIILDNRLAEIFKIDFNETANYRNISHVSTGSDSTLWLFNQDIMQLELYDYRNKITRAKTLPISNPVLAMASNYNSCWLLTKAFIYKYNYFGSLVYKIPNNGYTHLKESDENIILKKENQLYFLKKNTQDIKSLKILNLLIKQFLLTNEIVYIYTGGFLHQYQLKIK